MLSIPARRSNHLSCPVSARCNSAENDLERPRLHAARRLGPAAPWHLLLVMGFVYLLAVCQLAHAQEIIHARAGQVIAANPTTKTLTLKVADGSTLVFHDVVEPEPAMSFDKEVRHETTPALSFNAVGTYAAVFYFGYGDLTAVAVKSLSSNPPARTAGTVEGYDRHKHQLTLRTEKGTTQEVLVSNDTVVDTEDGVVRPADFHPSKGALVRCVSDPQSQAALFLVLN